MRARKLDDWFDDWFKNIFISIVNQYKMLQKRHVYIRLEILDFYTTNNFI